MPLSVHQNLYIDTTIKIKKVRDHISSPLEFEFIHDIFDELGLKEDVDYYHQYTFHNSEVLLVVDFFLPKFLIAVELDGSSHKNKFQRRLDKSRDKIVAANGVQTLRIKTPFAEDKKYFWFNFFREVFREDISE